MARRVLKVAGGRALIQTTDAQCGDYTEWVTLPPADTSQPITPLAQAAPEVPLTGGLYGNPDRRDTDRRRKADEVLQQHGVRPRRW